MSYKILNKDSVCEFLQEIDEVEKFFDGDTIEAKEIGDGNLNFVYLISSKQNPKKALIAKQAVPFLRCVGEEFPLSRERMTYEIRALQMFKDIAPSSVPDIYYASEEMSLLVMQYLDNHAILRTALIEETTYSNFAQHISTYLARTLFFTSSLHLQSDEKRALMDRFNHNVELCKLTEDFVFTFAYMENETNDLDNVKDNPQATKLFADMEFKEKVLELKYKFMTQADALAHGDLHTGSIMLNEDETYVIDPEFAFIAPFGFDIGALIANLTHNCIHHHIVTKNQNQKEYLLQTISQTLSLFESKFLKLWSENENSSLIIQGLLDDKTKLSYQTKFVKRIIQESIGFAGCKMARRVFGVAGVAEIRGIEDKQLRGEAEAMVLKIAREFVMKYDEIESIDDILEMISAR